MNEYRLLRTLPCPGNSISFIEFSTDGRLLIVGDRRIARLQVLDISHSGFDPTIDSLVIAQPTSLTFESSTSVLVGLADGRFAKYLIDLNSERLTHQWTNSTHHGAHPVVALTLDKTACVLALAIRSSVFLFRRCTVMGKFQFMTEVSDLDPKGDLKNPVFSLPKSLCFISTGNLLIAFHRQGVASLTFGSLKRHGRHSSPTILAADHSGLPVLRAVTSAQEQSKSDLFRFWIDGSSTPGEGNRSFLFINSGTATLSSPAPGIALIKDAITRRRIQALKHNGPTVHPLAMAYHVGENTYTIATASHGMSGSIKVWQVKKVQEFDDQPSISPMLKSLGLVMGGAGVLVAAVFSRWWE